MFKVKRLAKTLAVYTGALAILYASIAYYVDLKTASEFMLGLSPVFFISGAALVVLQLLNNNPGYREDYKPLSPLVVAKFGNHDESLMFSIDNQDVKVADAAVGLMPMFNVIICGGVPHKDYCVKIFKVRDSRRKGVRTDKCEVIRVLDVKTNDIGFFHMHEPFTFGYNAFDEVGRFFYYAEIEEIDARSSSNSLVFYR